MSTTNIPTFDSLIYELRGQKVMLDFDLAKLYGVKTKRLKEQVRRNWNRFPEDFMFELNNQEFTNLRSQFATSSYGGMRYTPMAFTEHGVSMLSSILNSETAIKINIEIMRAFSKYRAFIFEHKDLKSEIHELDQKIDKIFKYLLRRIDSLHQKKINTSRKKIGY